MMSSVLYHYTCPYLLPFILKSGYLTLTESNFSFEKIGMFPVVWLTDSPTPDNMGLLFDAGMPDDLNKTHIRLTLRKKSYMKRWDEWSDANGMDREQKQILISAASAENTCKSWYVSEQAIPLDDVLAIEHMKTGKTLCQK